jgi:redox-sensing transcriptional repressor
MRYYRLLAEWMAREPIETVTSAQLAQALDIDATQVRKDFSAIGLMGMGRVGFDVREVCHAIEAVLGFDHRYKAVLIGAGHLGGVLLAYSGFTRYGLHIMAAFDNGARRTGRKLAGCTIRPMKAAKPFITRHKIHLVILAPPTEPSQKLIDRLVAAGVKAIWNFTPAQLAGPPGVLVRNEQHFSIGLSEIAYHLKQCEKIDGQHNGATLPAVNGETPGSHPCEKP